MDDDLESFKHIVQVDYYTPMLGMSAFYPCNPHTLRQTELHYNKDRLHILERGRELLEKSRVYNEETPKMQALLTEREILNEELARLQEERQISDGGVAQRLEVRTLQAQIRELDNELNGVCRTSESLDDEMDELRKMNLQLSEFNDTAQMRQANLILEESNISGKLEEIALLEAKSALLEEQCIREPEDFAYTRRMQRADFFVNGEFQSGFMRMDSKLDYLTFFDIYENELLQIVVEEYEFVPDAREMARNSMGNRYESLDYFSAFRKGNDLAIIVLCKHDWLIWAGVIKSLLMIDV